MLLLGFDLETGGSFDLPLEENWITEIGAALWDTGTNTPVEMMNTLILPEGKEICEEAEEYTGITTTQCITHGVSEEVALTRFNEMASKADYLVAHNGAAFDIPILVNYYKRLGWDTPGKVLIDTMTDIPYPNNCKSRNLTYLNGFHLVLNSFPHRAITDVLAMLTILSKYDFDRVQEIVHSPKMNVVAKFSYPKERSLPPGMSFKDAMDKFNKVKNEVKNLGFKWQPESKQWVLSTREIIYKDMEFPCPVNIVK